jgi:translation elongation factor EF-Tu-like GTPase
MREQNQVTVEDVFDLTGRGIAILGTHSGGVINSGDAAVLRTADAETPVPEVWVELHSPPGRQALVLRGVTREQVQVGGILVGPTDQ